MSRPFTPAELEEIKRRNGAGDSMSTIARALHCADTRLRQAYREHGLKTDMKAQKRGYRDGRRIISAEELDEIHKRITAGDSICSIAKVLCRSKNTIRNVCAARGWKSQHKPGWPDQAIGKAVKKPVSTAELAQIHAMIEAGESLSAIGRHLNRHISVICRTCGKYGWRSCVTAKYAPKNPRISRADAAADWLDRPPARIAAKLQQLPACERRFVQWSSI